MRKLLVFAVILMESSLFGLILYVNLFPGIAGLDIYDQISLTILLAWMGVLSCYLAWGIYFYNFNFARSAEFWQRFRDKAIEYADRTDKTDTDVYEELEAPRANPYASETFGLPPGTIRGTLALTILMGGISLFVSLFSEDTPFADVQFYSYFQFFEDAFLMVIAFYFGTKGLEIIKRSSDEKKIFRASNFSKTEQQITAPIDEDALGIYEKNTLTPSLAEVKEDARSKNTSSDLMGPPPPPKPPKPLISVREQVIKEHYPHVKDTERNKFLTDDDIRNFALEWQLEEAAVRSVVKVESSGKGFLKDGRPKILFEGHVFWRQLKASGQDPEGHAAQNPDILYPRWTKIHYQGGKGEYDRLERAQLIHESAALSSASWGMFQVMGYHYKNLDYASVQEFVEKQSASEYEHLEAFGRFVRHFKLIDALRNKEWAVFARGYNGKGYKKNQYDVKLEKYYQLYRQEAEPVA